MMPKTKAWADGRKEKWLRMATWATVTLGILMRVVMLLQNRNLFIDEANIARNVYERTFPGLAMPLSYEQYAPPIFLWLLKLSSTLFGFSEYALRSYSLLTGMGALLVFPLVMKKMGIKSGLLYPLFLLATGLIFNRYATEVKQYMPDVFIALLLLWLALSIDIRRQTIFQFVVIWFTAGTVAIWSSMPSVFVLAGVGLYYGYQCLRSRDSKQLMPVIIVSILWLMQFSFYYTNILEPEATSSYLHNYHKGYFIFLLPNSITEWQHNLNLIDDILSEAAGYTALATIFNVLLLVGGAFILFRKQMDKALLIAVPIIALLLAAGLGKFSLIPRVSLFIMPLFLLLMGTGLDSLLRIPSKIVMVMIVIVAGINAFNYSQLQLFVKPWKNEEITDGMKLLLDDKLTAQNLFVHEGAAPAFIYYTEIHPGKDKWQALRYARTLSWNSNCEIVAQAAGTLGFLYANGDEGEMTTCRKGVLKHKKLRASLTEKGCSAFVYDDK